MNELKKADEVVRALRDYASDCDDCCDCFQCDFACVCGKFDYNAPKIIADLIESQQAQLTDYHHMEQLVDGKMAENQRLRKINEKLQSQLAASQRREQAAREDLNGLARFEEERCAYCLHDEECEPGEMLCSYKGDKAFEWRGPQDAEKGEADGN